MELPSVTLVCIDCLNHFSALAALHVSKLSIRFGEVLFLTDKMINKIGTKTIIIDRIMTKEKYSEFVMMSLPDYIQTDHCLIIQYDGYVIRPDKWDFGFLAYDYIGAPWWYNENNVGNGGFSLRSKRLLKAVKEINPEVKHPEDDVICRRLRPVLENDYKIRFADEQTASRFSFEPNGKYPNFTGETFGFHGIPQLIR